MRFNPQVALLVLTLGEADDPFVNSIALKETVLPHSWHSFCISIDIEQKQVLVTHNGKVEANQPIEDVEDKYLRNFELLRFGLLGGTYFVGTIAEFEVFGHPLPLQELLQWTTCQIKGKILSLKIFSFHQIFSSSKSQEWSNVFKTIEMAVRYLTIFP